MRRSRITQKQLIRATLSAGVATLMLAPIAHVSSETLTSPNFRLDPNVSNSFGGLSQSGSYSLLDSGGEAAIGFGSSDSYKLDSGYIAQLQQSLELNVLPEGLEAYYPLNTGVGIQAYDTTTNNNHGVIEGVTNWQSGIIGRQSLGFDGSTRVATPFGAGINHFFADENNAWSTSAWFRTGTAQTGDGLILAASDGTGTSATFAVFVNQSGDLQVRIRGGGVHTIASNVVDDSWHQVAITWDGTSAEAYFNGVNTGEVPVGTATNQNRNLHIGGNDSFSGNASEFIGLIDEVRALSRPLSSNEVKDAHDAALGGVPNALTIPELVAGTSQTVGAEAVVLTDAPGYSLAVSQDGNLRLDNEGDEIPQINGSIQFPEAWNEGTTTGLGFTIVDAIGRDSKWGSDPNFAYAALPDTTTSFHSRTGFSGGTKDVIDMQLRIGVDGAQSAGVYRNRLGFSATIKP